DPAVAGRADVLAAVMAQLAGIADTPGPPPAPVEAILAAVTAAAATPPSAGGAMPLAAPAGAGAAAGGQRRPRVRPPDDPAFAKLAGRPRSGSRRDRSTRPSGPGSPRRDRVLSGLVVVLLLAVLATVGIQSLREGGPFRDPPPTTAGEGRGDGDQAGQGTAEDDTADDDTADGDTADDTDQPDVADGGSTEDPGDATSPADPATPSPQAPADGPSDGDTGVPSAPGSTGSDAGTGGDRPGSGGTGQVPPGDSGDQPAGPGTGQPAEPDPSPEASPPPSDGTPAPPEGGPEDDDGGQDGTGGQGGGSEEPTAGDPPPQEGADGDSAMTSPTVADSMVDLPDEQAARAYFGDRPEAQQLIGLSGAEAQERAARHARDVQVSPPFASGVHPANCLDVATAGPGTTVIAAVESATYGGRASLAHLIVTGEDTLTRAFVVVADCTTCEVLLRVEVPV
ncbi:MAG TPA: hypothetical protein VMM13_07335, partial [Euzebya sp.]|nr:hypothetical protein [Euzebya sp.]